MNKYNWTGVLIILFPLLIWAIKDINSFLMYIAALAFMAGVIGFIVLIVWLLSHE